jgi:KipI family sensor histidine kinase inhibitor
VIVRSYGAGALLVELDSTAAAIALRQELDDAPLPGVVETMPGLHTVMVGFDPRVVSAQTLARRLTELDLASAAPPVDGGDSPAVQVPVAYDGPDLDEVAAYCDLAVDQVVAAHAEITYRVALIGMAPGFYFLAGGDPRLQPPRRPSPRERVPRGAVGLAGPFTGIYPKDGPGGWQLIGRVLDDLWHPTRLPAALLEPGTSVRFTAA